MGARKLVHAKSGTESKRQLKAARRIRTEIPKRFARGPLLDSERILTLANVNIKCPDDVYLKLKVYISELILDRY